ncbi:MAG: ATP-dependent zinc metalloprotease FtsH [Chloroflexota bacterium]
MKQALIQILDFFKKHKYAKLGVALVLVTLIFASAYYFYSTQQEQPLALSEVARAISAGNVTKIEDTADSGQLVITHQDGSTHTALRDKTSSFLEQMKYLGVSESEMAQLQYKIVKPSALASDKTISAIMSLLMLCLAGFVVMRVVGGGAAGNKKFTQGDIPDTTFDDVAGIDECREELVDVVAFLKDNSQYQHMGARMPRGMLLVGEPGTGKTLLAKAIAGEAGVPFFTASGSEFVEMFVGVGAGRMRSLFKKARAKAPSIIFIDEVDAVGRKRSSNGGGGEMEQNQTLNQMLVEMDGFSPAEGVIVLAATNRMDVLDPALTRPGRFDRHVNVPRPDIKGRLAILNVHIKGRRLASDVNLLDVARSTPGLVGADLANIVNEAAILAVRAGHAEISILDFQEAIEKNLTGGIQQKGRVMKETERRTIAYHEAGHAVVMHRTPNADPIYKITIIPRGQMGGFTMALPTEDSILMSRNQFLARITGLMGGRVAEELFCDDITSGASNDLQVATQLAEDMVMRLGMSATGLRVFNRQEGYAGLAAPHTGQKTFEILDEAIKQILDECYAEAKRIITENRAATERVTQCLLQQETMTREEFLTLMEDTVLPLAV